MWMEYERRANDAAGASMFSYFTAVKAILFTEYNIDATGWLKCKAWLKSREKETKDRKHSAPVFTAEQVFVHLCFVDECFFSALIICSFRKKKNS